MEFYVELCRRFGDKLGKLCENSSFQEDRVFYELQNVLYNVVRVIDMANVLKIPTPDVGLKTLVNDTVNNTTFTSPADFKARLDATLIKLQDVRCKRPISDEELLILNQLEWQYQDITFQHSLERSFAVKTFSNLVDDIARQATWKLFEKFSQEIFETKRTCTGSDDKTQRVAIGLVRFAQTWVRRSKPRGDDPYYSALVQWFDAVCNGDDNREQANREQACFKELERLLEHNRNRWKIDVHALPELEFALVSTKLIPNTQRVTDIFGCGSVSVDFSNPVAVAFVVTVSKLSAIQSPMSDFQTVINWKTQACRDMRSGNYKTLQRYMTCIQTCLKFNRDPSTILLQQEQFNQINIKAREYVSKEFIAKEEAMYRPWLQTASAGVSEPVIQRNILLKLLAGISREIQGLLWCQGAEDIPFALGAVDVGSVKTSALVCYTALQAAFQAGASLTADHRAQLKESLFNLPWRLSDVENLWCVISMTNPKEMTPSITTEFSKFAKLLQDDRRVQVLADFAAALSPKTPTLRFLSEQNPVTTYYLKNYADYDLPLSRAISRGFLHDSIEEVIGYPVWIIEREQPPAATAAALFHKYRRILNKFTVGPEEDPAKLINELYVGNRSAYHETEIEKLLLPESIDEYTFVYNDAIEAAKSQSRMSEGQVLLSPTLHIYLNTSYGGFVQTFIDSKDSSGLDKINAQDVKQTVATLSEFPLVTASEEIFIHVALLNVAVAEIILKDYAQDLPWVVHARLYYRCLKHAQTLNKESRTNLALAALASWKTHTQIQAVVAHQICERVMTKISKQMVQGVSDIWRQSAATKILLAHWAAHVNE